MDFTTTADRLLAELQSTYQKYTCASSHERKKKGIGDMFSSWMQSNPQLEAVHLTFLEGVERIVTELAALLAEFHAGEPERCRDYAHRALDIIFAPKPGEERNDVERFLPIAEYQGPALFPYASREQLERIHKEQLERKPKRYMPPNQLKLLKLLEDAIAE